MQRTLTPQPIPSSSHRTPLRNWLILGGLFVLSQLLNGWIITRTVSGGFEGWVDGLRRDAPPALLAAPETQPATTLVLALPQTNVASSGHRP